MSATIVVVGAGQLGVTFALLLDRWQRAQKIRSPRKIILIERGDAVLHGATRASWIDHATGFEYFKRGEVNTARACIQGSITKRLLLPPSLLKMPVPIRNRFFVSAESNRSGAVAFDDFVFQARRGLEFYRSIHDDAAEELRSRLVPPMDFMRFVERDEYYGVSSERTAGGLVSAGGMSNMAMEVAFKHTALAEAKRREAIIVRTNTIVDRIDDTRSGVVVTLKGDPELLHADCVIFTAAHGITDLVHHVQGRDLQGSYHLNFMLHVTLPKTRDVVLQHHAASVNFVLQGAQGGMYACVVPPTANTTGFAAMFAPGYDGSYVDEYSTKAHERPAVPWNDIIASGNFPGRNEKAKTVLRRICRLNPFLEDYLKRLKPNRDYRAVVGSVFNPDGEARSLRRLTKPMSVTESGRVLAMTSPKWTTTELAAVTLLQGVLEVIRSPLLKTGINGFGPYRVDVLASAPDLALTDLHFPRSEAMAYLDSLALPRRILPERHELFSAGIG